MNAYRILFRGLRWLSPALFAFAALADDANWPRFRGPNGGGIGAAANVPIQWTTNDYRWKVRLSGIGHSSPVVWGSRLFVTCGEPATGRRIVLCLNAASGRTLWQREYESQMFSQSGDNSYATATPTADADGVVVTWTTPDQVTLLALDNQGRDLWRRDLGKYVCIHGSGSSPLIIDDLVVLDNDQEDPKALPPSVYAAPGAPKSAGSSFLIGLDRKTGQTRWQLGRATSQAAYITPCVYRPEGGRPEIILASTLHGVTGVDPATGTVKWELDKVLRGHLDSAGAKTNPQEEPLFTERLVSSPVVADGLVFASEGRGSAGVRTVAVRPASDSNNTPPKLAYEITKSVPLVPTPLARVGRLYLWADNGIVTCLRTTTGEILWREKVSGSFYSSPVCVNDRLYCAAKNGEVVILAAADKFEVLGRVPLGEKCFATPAIAGGVMYWRTTSHLFALGGEKQSGREPR
jgi:outer membrane protein assembly factor BamB